MLCFSSICFVFIKEYCISKIFFCLYKLYNFIFYFIFIEILIFIMTMFIFQNFLLTFFSWREVKCIGIIILMNLIFLKTTTFIKVKVSHKHFQYPTVHTVCKLKTYRLNAMCVHNVTSNVVCSRICIPPQKEHKNSAYLSLN